MWSWRDDDSESTSQERSKLEQQSPAERPPVVVSIHLGQHQPDEDAPPEAEEPKRS